jgi:hypothetical protein
MKFMRSVTASSPRGLRVPPHEVESYIACGWMIASEPTCGDVLMVPPSFSDNSKKMGGHDRHRGPPNMVESDARNSSRKRSVEAR